MSARAKRIASGKPSTPLWVGQRVRIVENVSELSGHHATITKIAMDDLCAPGVWKGQRRVLCHFLDVDRVGERWPDGTGIAASAQYLEPIYDGDQPSSWSKCEWRPKPSLLRRLEAKRDRRPRRTPTEEGAPS